MNTLSMEKHRVRAAMVAQVEVINVCLAAFEAFRRLGFKPEEIFFTYFTDRIAMVLRAQGKEFIADCGARSPVLTDQDIIQIWNERTSKWNAGMTQTERMQIWNGGMPVESLISMALAIKKIGIVFPNEVIENLFPKPTSEACRTCRAEPCVCDRFPGAGAG